MPFISRSDFLANYEFPTEPEIDFDINGQTPEWASGHPKQWSQGHDAIDLPLASKNNSKRCYKQITSAVSYDSKLLAVSSDNGRIQIYDVGSKELRQELDGLGDMAFVPALQSSEGSADNVMEAAEHPKYTLVSSVVGMGVQSVMFSPSRLILWELDKNGRLLVEEEPIDTAAFATKAIESIADQLNEQHEWSREFLAQSRLHADFKRALKSAAANHRRRYNNIIQNARLPNYGSTPFSSDGKLMLYIQPKGDDNQFPRVFVYDIYSANVVLSFDGHTDTCLYASFSPNNQNIATTSLDGTMRMHSADTGELLWVAKKCGGQSWACAFTPDGKHVIWSCEGGLTVQVHSVSDGRIVSTFKKRLNQQCMSMTWHPDGQHLALCAGCEVYVWRPFDGINGTIIQHFKLPEDEWYGFDKIKVVQWIEHGRKLVLLAYEGTTLVWDVQTNSKELFKRNHGTQVTFMSPGFYYIADEGQNTGDMYLSVNGDGKVRYWRTSVPAESWWDKKGVTVPKREYPETGKYVNITKLVKPKEERGVS